MLLAILMKFKNLNATRNFHAMKEISHSYNLMIYFISDNLGGKCYCCSEKVFYFILYEADNAESQ